MVQPFLASWRTPRPSNSGFMTASLVSTQTGHDGLHSYPEMVKELQRASGFSRPTSESTYVKTDPDDLAIAYRALFGIFDHHSSGTVDLEEFKAETKQTMLAMHGKWIGILTCRMGIG
uniref:EF-hand domain-containing protein n=1 Tax=Nelumbo nucifera TaxID=4432 RepID=A0A822XKT3_NELNU|nr:TPA_asm: hypothetical protein HUJ06_021796 [Nelumbo nucifera]